MRKSLIEKAHEFIKHGHPYDQEKLLHDCVLNGSHEALAAVKMMAGDMYGGITYNTALKSPAGFCLLAWGKDGLDALSDNALEEPELKNYTLGFRILGSVAAGQIPKSLHFARLGEEVVALVIDSIGDVSLLKESAKICMNKLVMSIKDEDELTLYLGNALMGMSLLETNAAKPLFQSLSRRFLSVGLPQIQEFEQILKNSPKDEPTFQSFLERNPLFVDPMALRVWPRPDFHGKKEPDFVVQRTDNSYLVVEIETPSKQLVTKQNQLSAETTQAVTQVLDYHSFLVERFSEASNTFPNFSRPDCLVVCGMENSLNSDQIKALKRENEHRSLVKIIGFDSLLNRAKAITNNIIDSSITVESIRLK